MIKTLFVKTTEQIQKIWRNIFSPWLGEKNEAPKQKHKSPRNLKNPGKKKTSPGDFGTNFGQKMENKRKKKRK